MCATRQNQVSDFSSKICTVQEVKVACVSKKPIINMCTIQCCHVTDRGKLKVRPHPYRPHLKPLMPATSDDKDCRDVNSTIQCFAAGNCLF